MIRKGSLIHSTREEAAQPVYLANTPEIRSEHLYEPQRVRVLDNSTASIVVNNNDRTYGNPFNFTVKLGAQVQSIRRVGVRFAKAQIPCTMINDKNNRLQIYNQATNQLYNIVITNGDYDGDGLAAELQLQLNISVPIAPAFTVQYDGRGGNIIISRINTLNRFQIVTTSPFIRYGKDVHGIFPIYEYDGTIPPPFPGYEVVVGERATFIFSPLWVISCNQLTQYEKNNSSSSNPKNSDAFLILVQQRPITLGGIFPKLPAAPLTYIPADNEGIIYNPNQIPYKTFFQETQISELSFTVRDAWGDDPMEYTDSPNTWSLILDIITYV